MKLRSGRRVGPPDVDNRRSGGGSALNIVDAVPLPDNVPSSNPLYDVNTESGSDDDTVRAPPLLPDNVTSSNPLYDVDTESETSPRNDT